MAPLRDQPLPVTLPPPSVKRIVSTSVRDLVEFVLRTGDLGGSSHFTGPNRALEGTRAHQKLQKSRPSGYQAEVSLSHTVETAEFIFQLKGRIDGVFVQDGSILIEEIKTVSCLDGIVADPLHWAQARVYAHLLCLENGFSSATVQLTYVELDSFQSVEFKETFSAEYLAAFFENVLAEYLEWMREHQRWIEVRNRSAAVARVSVPVSSGAALHGCGGLSNYQIPRPPFCRSADRHRQDLSVLFPAIKALGEGHIEKIFYLTAKTIGRTVAENTLADLRRRA